MRRTMRLTFFHVLCVSLLQFSSCVTYHSRPLTSSAVEKALTVPSGELLQREALRLNHPILRPIELDPHQPLSPDAAAVLAVLINPVLRADRDRAGVSAAQLIVAGLLPNPQLTYSRDFLTSGPGITSPFGIGIAWDFTSLITRGAKVRAAQAALEAVRIDVAWSEWQTAEAAKAAVFDEVAIENQLTQAQAVDQRLKSNADVIRGAYDRHQRTALDMSAAQTASETAHATVLTLEQQLTDQRLALLRALGLPPGTNVTLRADIRLPSLLTVPSAEELSIGVEARRLDLVALRRGYQSQEESVRAAVLSQFPRINLGGNRAKDNTNVRSVGFAATVDLPIFDRNQGGVALERATRQKLFDEYVARVYTAKSDIGTQLADIESLTVQIDSAAASLPALRQLVATYEQALKYGNADVLSYYTAWNSLSQKEIALEALKQQLVSREIALELASGTLLPQPLVAASSQPEMQSSVSPGTGPSPIEARP
jgi:outer membrane protein, heavy metal efflux system